MLKQGIFRAEKILYPDGIGCCVWIPFDEDDDSIGIAFDFPGEAIEDLIYLLNQLDGIEPELYEDEDGLPAQNS